MALKPYRNRSGKSGIVAYDYGLDGIRIQFLSDSVPFDYTGENVGKANLEEMKRLADAGDGLTTFINQSPEVKNGYVRRGLVKTSRKSARLRRRWV